jgi:cyclopropane fatty-acyl-phospholipid synthase-like methyltransferase
MTILRICALTSLALFLGGCCGRDGSEYREAMRARREAMRDLRDAQSQYRNQLRQAQNEFRRRANEARMEMRESLRRHRDYDYFQ